MDFERVERRVRATALLTALVVSALIGSVHILLPCALVLLPIPLSHARALYRALANCVAGAWFTFAAALLEWLALVEIKLSGEGGVPQAAGERVVVLMCNHYCRVDWLFLWPIACRLARASSLKVALKEDLKRVPFFGWATQAFLFLFLSRRNRADDLQRIEKLLTYLVHDCSQPALLLIFPEGSDLSDSNRAKDAAFAAQSGGQPYTHVLHPRTAGFAQALKALGPRLDAVYDATIWYEPHALEVARNARPSEMSLLLGTFPRAVHVHVDRFERASLPALDQEEAVSAWLRARWEAKEGLLAKVQGTGAQQPQPHRARAALRAEYALALAGWGGLAACLVAGCWHSRALVAYTLLGSVLLAVLTDFCGGLDQTELALSRRRYT